MTKRTKSDATIPPATKRVKRSVGIAKPDGAQNATTTQLPLDKITSPVTSEGDESSESENEMLLKGFEDVGKDIASALPKPQAVEKKILVSKSETQTQIEGEKTGTVYLGRIPHGFYEHQMRQYFSQFGTITRLRLARNKSTGKSKHFAFIEFSSASVAKIVAETMNNYLLFGHILKCRVVPQEDCNERMWIGANRRWKVVPLNKIRKKRHEAKRSQSAWDKLEEKELRRRSAKQAKLKELGIEYSLDDSK